MSGSLLSVSQAHAFYGEEQILANGSSNDTVVQLQEDLRILGYFTYPTNTGYFGDITADAVKAFQRDHHLDQNGKVGRTTGPLIKEEADKKRPQASELGAKVVETAKKYVGTPYAWGGRSASGFDCSGFVSFVLSQQNVDVPRTSYDMYAQGKSISSARPGDLVFFTTYDTGASHVGIYLGNQQFISAASSGVKIDSLGDSYWGPRFVGARSVF